MSFLLRFEADVTESIPVGLVPEGIRLDVHFSGRVVEGALSGATLRGIDYLLLRADGIGVVDAHDLISTETGQHISVHGQGYTIPPSEVQMPPPEVMLSSEFQWPEAPIPMHGFALCRTGARELAWMNRTALGFEGTVNMGAGKIAVEVRALHPAAAEAAGLTIVP